MALSKLDGSNTNIDVSVGGNSLRCWTNFWSANIVRDFTEATTFCDSGWRSRTPGFKQLVGRISGIAAKGVAGTNPATYMASSSTMAFVLTADTGCSFTFDGHVGNVGVAFLASQNSTFGLDYESAGAVTTVWVVS